MIAGIPELVSTLQEHVLEGQGWLAGCAQAEPEPPWVYPVQRLLGRLQATLESLEEQLLKGAA